VVIDNNPARTPSSPRSSVAKSAADGFTLLVNATAHVVNPVSMRSFRTIRSRISFRSVWWKFSARAGGAPFGAGELGTGARRVRQRPIPASSTTARLDRSRSRARCFKQMTGTDIKHIPPRAAPRLDHRVIAGDVQMTIVDTPPLVPQSRGESAGARR